MKVYYGWFNSLLTLCFISIQIYSSFTDSHPLNHSYRSANLSSIEILSFLRSKYRITPSMYHWWPEIRLIRLPALCMKIMPATGMAKSIPGQMGLWSEYKLARHLLSGAEGRAHSDTSMTFVHYYISTVIFTKWRNPFTRDPYNRGLATWITMIYLHCHFWPATRLCFDRFPLPGIQTGHWGWVLIGWMGWPMHTSLWTTPWLWSLRSTTPTASHKLLTIN